MKQTSRQEVSPKGRVSASTPSPINALSVDFGAHTLKMVEVEWGPLGPIVKTFGVSPYIRDRKNQADLVATLEELKHAAQASSREIILSLSETDAFIITEERACDPNRLDEDIAAWQDYLIQNIEPSFAAANYIWPMTAYVDKISGHVRFQFLTVPRLILDFYKEVIKTAGLDLVGVSHLPTALGRGLRQSGRTAVLDIGADSSAWYVYDNGLLVQRSTIPYGSEALTEALARAHDWDVIKAENHKRSLAGEASSWPETTRLVVESFLKQWWTDLFEHLAERPSNIERILLSGGGSKFGPIREFIFNQFGVMPEDWHLPAHAHIAEQLRTYVEPHLPVLVNSLVLLVYS